MPRKQALRPAHARTRAVAFVVTGSKPPPAPQSPVATPSSPPAPPSTDDDLYAPRPLSIEDRLGKLLLAIEIPDCGCPPTCHCEHIAKCHTKLSIRTWVSLLHEYDLEGYEPELVWSGPVWLGDPRSPHRIDVSKGVSMATQEGWTEVYAVRAKARLPLFHPDDDNPRSRAEDEIALQGVAGNRQGYVRDERLRNEAPALRPKRKKKTWRGGKLDYLIETYGLGGKAAGATEEHHGERQEREVGDD